MKELAVVGSTAYISVGGVSDVPAKIDTGADSSVIWASDISVNAEGELCFKLFGPESELYTGEVLSFKPGEYKAAVVMSSNGQVEYRYRVHLPLCLAGKKIRAGFSLADRSRNSMPVLIGRRTLMGKFYVDVSINPTGRRPSFCALKRYLNEEMQQDPQAFHLKYKGAES